MLCARFPASTPVSYLALALSAALLATACGKKAASDAPAVATKVTPSNAKQPAAKTAPAKSPKAAPQPAAATLTVPPTKKPTVAPPPPVIAKVGGYAPDFVLPSTDGQEVRLSDHKGQIIVLEWFNPDCPFVRHAHTKGALKTMARDWAAKGVFWIAINSGAKGMQGHGQKVNAAALETWGLDHPVLLDESGMVGRKYGADHTPHVFVIDGLGKVRYAGAIDNMPFGELTEPKAVPTPYLKHAIEAVGRGQDPAIPQTKSWGCSVKYAK